MHDGVDVKFAEGVEESVVVVEVGEDGGDFEDFGDDAMAAGEVVVDDGMVAGFFEAFDGVGADVAGAACDENVHGGRDTAKARGRIG
jgi:hypothetical protein